MTEVEMFQHHTVQKGQFRFSAVFRFDLQLLQYIGEQLISNQLSGVQ